MFKLSWNSTDLRTRIEGFMAVLTPALSKAKILTASVDGKSIPIAEATPADQLKAFLAVNPPGEDKQKDADLLVTNADIAARLEKAESDLSVANATIGGLQTKVRDLETRSTTAESTVQKMTAERGQIDLELTSSRSEFARVNRDYLALNSEISRRALLVNCLSDLRDPATKELLSSKATADERQKSAEMVPPADKLTAIFGALHSAASKIGVDLSSKPSEQPGGPAAVNKPKSADAEIAARLASQK